MPGRQRQLRRLTWPRACIRAPFLTGHLGQSTIHSGGHVRRAWLLDLGGKRGGILVGILGGHVMKARIGGQAAAIALVLAAAAAADTNVTFPDLNLEAAEARRL